MSFPSILFTSAGYTLQAKAQIGTPIIFTRIAMGDGRLTGQVTQELKNLISFKKDVPLNKFQAELDGMATVGGTLDNQDMDQGFYWREIGLFAKDPDNETKEILYCYGNAGEMAEYIPAGGESQILEKRIQLTTIIGNAPNVSAQLTTSTIFVTQTDLDNELVILRQELAGLDGKIKANAEQIKDCFGRLLEVENQVGNIDVSWSGIKEKPTVFPPSDHNHPASQITGLPTSLPANGGNANTVGGMQPYQLATLSAGGSSHGASYPLYCKHNAFGDARFALLVDGHETRVHYATYSTEANNSQVVQGRNLCAEVDGLKSSVVSGKQLVVNAINGKMGYNSGLTTNNSHNDYAWWITNKLGTINYGVKTLIHSVQLNNTGLLKLNNGGYRMLYIELVNISFTISQNITIYSYPTTAQLVTIVPSVYCGGNPIPSYGTANNLEIYKSSIHGSVGNNISLSTSFSVGSLENTEITLSVAGGSIKSGTFNIYGLGNFS